MQYHRLGGLNNKHLFLTVLEAGKSKIKVLADSVPGEAPRLQTAVFLLCPHKMKVGPNGERERAQQGSVCFSSSYKDTNPIMEALPSLPYLNLIISQRPHLQIPSYWG